jgi:hypothetical protein
VHVLIDCPRLRQPRQKLREKIGDHFNNLSLMLGGKPRNEGTSTEGKWSITRKELDAVLDFAEDSQKFKCREGNIADPSQSQDQAPTMQEETQNQH